METLQNHKPLKYKCPDCKNRYCSIKILQTGMRNMILAIDIGNTNIVVGCIDKEKIYPTYFNYSFGIILHIV